MPIISGGGSGGLPGVAVSGTPASGKTVVASAANAAAWAYPPSFEIGYDQVTSDTNVASTTSTAPTVVVTGTSYTFDGGPVIIYYGCSCLKTGTTSASSVILRLYQSDATTILGAYFLQTQTPAGVINGAPAMGINRFTPTAGAHSYVLGAYATNVTGTPVVSGIAWMRIVKA